MKISDRIIKKIKEIQNRNLQKSEWANALYRGIRRLEIDERGQLGEEITVEILKSLGCDIEYDPNKTDVVKGWDLISNNIKIEVKLATITRKSGSFQHENPHSQRDFDGILFIDIAPEEVYLTAVCKNDILWRNIHRRPNGNYKLDFTIKHLRNNAIKQFKKGKYKIGLINSDEDFYNIYRWIEDNK